MLCHLKEVQEVLGHVLAMWLWINDTDPVWLGITFVGAEITKIHASCCLSALGTQPVLIQCWLSPPHPYHPPSHEQPITGRHGETGTPSPGEGETWAGGNDARQLGLRPEMADHPETGTGNWWSLVQVRFWLFSPDSQSCTYNWLISDILTASPKCRVLGMPRTQVLGWFQQNQVNLGGVVIN